METPLWHQVYFSYTIPLPQQLEFFMCLVHQPNWIWTFKACLHITQTIAQHSFSVLRTFLSPLREWFTDDKRGTCVFGFHEWPRLLFNSKHIVNSFGSIHFHSLGSWQQSSWFSHTIIWGGGLRGIGLKLRIFISFSCNWYAKVRFCWTLSIYFCWTPSLLKL